MINVEKFIDYLKSSKIPPEPPQGSSPGGWDWKMLTFNHRNEATSRGMWAIVDKVWTKKLADWIGNRTCLEVMAGAGWLAKALSEYNTDIIATDSKTWNNRHSKLVIVHNIEKLTGLRAVRKYHNQEILIISWPPYNDKHICYICKQWGSKKPIIYIGEEGGCNAPSQFWNHFTLINPQPDIPLMAWTGIHDSVFIGHYQPSIKQKGNQ